MFLTHPQLSYTAVKDTCFKACRRRTPDTMAARNGVVPVMAMAAVVSFYNSATAVLGSPVGGAVCPGDTMKVDGPFTLAGVSPRTWVACEDIAHPDGALVLVPETGEAEWFAKGYAAYVPYPEAHYYDDLNVTFTSTGPDERHPTKPHFTCVGEAVQPWHAYSPCGSPGVMLAHAPDNTTWFSVLLAPALSDAS